MSGFGLTDEEIDFLGSHVGPGDVAWEWGSGGSTLFLASRCRRVTTVEHQPGYAARAIQLAHGHRNISVLYVPPDLPYTEGGEDDGDLATFRNYVESYSGRGIDVVLIDGRARCAAALWAVERAPFGPDPLTRFFLHDCEREQYAPIFEMLREDCRVGRLALLRMRMP